MLKKERPHCLITMANRRFALSTEFYLHVDVPFEMFFIAIGKHDQDGHPIGYMKFTKVAGSSWQIIRHFHRRNGGWKSGQQRKVRT